MLPAEVFSFLKFKNNKFKKFNKNIKNFCIISVLINISFFYEYIKNNLLKE